MQKRIECVISGRVQGVLFRDFTQRFCSSLGLVGFVCNQSDGTVLVVAEGEQDILDRLVPTLKKGSKLSNVKNVDVVSKSPTGEFEKFTIRYSSFWDRF